MRMEESADVAAWAHCPSFQNGPVAHRERGVLDEQFVREMESEILAEEGVWMEWVKEAPPQLVQATLAEGLQRNFGALLRSPLLCGEGRLHLGSGYKHLVHLANFSMMLAAAVRHEVTTAQESRAVHACAIAEMMGGVR